MISALPTGRVGQILALGLAFAMLASAYLLVAAPLIELYVDRTGLIQTHRSLLVKLRSVAAELPVLRARIADIRATGDSRRMTLDGATDAVASASLQGRVEELASAAGVTIGSTEGLPVADRGTYRRVGLRMVLRGSYESLVMLLARLETAVPPLVVDNVQMHASQRRPGPASSAASSAAALDASIEIYGFRDGSARIGALTNR